MAELPRCGAAGGGEGALVLLISSLTQGYTWEHQTNWAGTFCLLIVCTSLRI